MDQFKGSRKFNDHQWNSSATGEGSRVIILKSRLNSTGHSACTSKVRNIFDRQTFVPNDWWQLMCSNILQPWDRRNSMTAPVCNITPLGIICYQILQMERHCFSIFNLSTFKK